MIAQYGTLARCGFQLRNFVKIQKISIFCENPQKLICATSAVTTPTKYMIANSTNLTRLQWLLVFFPCLRQDIKERADAKWQLFGLESRLLTR